MKCCLLTGATGMVGTFLVRRALNLGLPLAVLARDKGLYSASQRLPKGVKVLQGDLTSPGLGLSESDLSWLKENCHSLLHSGARVHFQSDPETGDPYRTNVDGTRHALNLCREVGIKKFGYLSTAYVCGDRSGPILESELDEGQSFQNDYERSKFLAEGLVRQADFLANRVILRPSVVLGDSRDGYTPSFQGVYGLIQLASLVTPSEREPLLKRLGSETIHELNLVTADWVAEQAWDLFESPTGPLVTYHLTHQTPTPVGSLLEALNSLKLEKTNPLRLERMVEAPKNLLPLLGYLRQHPTFQSSVPISPEPLSLKTLTQIANFAIQNNFLPPLPEGDGGGLLQKLAERDLPAELSIEFTDGNRTGLHVSQAELFRCKDHQSPATVFLKESVLARLIQGQLTLDSAIYQGVLALESDDTLNATRLFSNFIHRLGRLN